MDEIIPAEVYAGVVVVRGVKPPWVALPDWMLAILPAASYAVRVAVAPVELDSVQPSRLTPFAVTRVGTPGAVAVVLVALP